MAIRAIIFDCFEVLVQSAPASLRADFPQVADELRDVFVRGDYGFITREEYIAEIMRLTGLSEADYLARYWNNKLRNEPAFQLVDELRSQGFRVAMLSNISRRAMDTYVTAEEREQRFDAVVLSSEVQLQKPDPAIFTLMAERLDVQPGECIMVDDILENIDGAERAGMHGVVYADVSSAREHIMRIVAEQGGA